MAMAVSMKFRCSECGEDTESDVKCDACGIVFDKPAFRHFRETLASLCHTQWSGWMIHLFSKCQSNPDGTVTMPKWAVERWMRQMTTEYANLSAEEKETDCKEADRFIKLLEEK